MENFDLSSKIKFDEMKEIKFDGEQKFTIPKWKTEVTPLDKLILAKWVLAACAVIFVLSGIAFLQWPTTGATIFDACKTIIPSITTLVLGYYFGQLNRTEH